MEKRNQKRFLLKEMEIDKIAVRQISDAIKLRLNMKELDGDTDVLLTQIIELVLKMYLSKDLNTTTLQ